MCYVALFSKCMCVKMCIHLFAHAQIHINTFKVMQAHEQTHADMLTHTQTHTLTHIVPKKKMCVLRFLFLLLEFQLKNLYTQKLA